MKVGDGQLNIAAKKLFHYFDSVSLSYMTPKSLPKVVYNRLNQHYKVLLNLAKLVLENSSLNFQETGEIAFSSFLVDMNLLFQKFLTSYLKHNLGGYVVKSASRLGGPYALTETGEWSQNPDIVIKRGSTPVLVMDAKYKILNESDHDVIQSDVAQVLAYTFAVGVPLAVLIYPRCEGTSIVDSEPRKIREVEKKVGRNVVAQQTYHLCVAAETKSQARLVGVTRDRIVLRGDTFKIRFRFRNPSRHQVFPGGLFMASIEYITGQREHWIYKPLPILGLGEEHWTEYSDPLRALAEGIAFVRCASMFSTQGAGVPMSMVYEDYANPPRPISVVHGIHVEARRDYHTYFALVVSLASLVTLISERVSSTFLVDAVGRVSYGPVLLAWYAILAVVTVFILLSTGRDC